MRPFLKYRLRPSSILENSSVQTHNGKPSGAGRSFQHTQHAHCESGVTSALFTHHGLPLSEPMAFGIGAGIFFAHLPFVKVAGVPGTTFRIWPGAIFKRAAARLGVKTHTERFRTPQAAEAALDAALSTGTPVGMLSSVYNLTYLPEAFRFRFNAHNLVAYGKEGGEYLISDPVMENATRITPADLSKARFAKGTPEPRGAMYRVLEVPKHPDLGKAIRAGIRQTAWYMLSPPVPWFGVRSIGTLAARIQRYPEKLSPRKAALYLGNVIRMQEEIGTGGAGFRFLYAAFLQEASGLLRRDDLAERSSELTAIGDAWRAFAYSAARTVKARTSDRVSFAELSAALREIEGRETAFFKSLKRLSW